MPFTIFRHNSKQYRAKTTIVSKQTSESPKYAYQLEARSIIQMDLLSSIHALLYFVNASSERKSSFEVHGGSRDNEQQSKNNEMPFNSMKT